MARFLATDGNVYGSRIQINLAKQDEDHLRKWIDFLGADMAIKQRTRAGIGNRTKPYELVSCAFRSKVMVTDLLNHGITPKKSFTVKPWDGPEHLMTHYWRGCVDGDGWVRPNAIGFCGNIDMVDGFCKFIYNAMGINGRTTQKEGKNFKTVNLVYIRVWSK